MSSNPTDVAVKSTDPHRIVFHFNKATKPLARSTKTLHKQWVRERGGRYCSARHRDDLHTPSLTRSRRSHRKKREVLKPHSALTSHAALQRHAIANGYSHTRIMLPGQNYPASPQPLRTPSRSVRGVGGDGRRLSFLSRNSVSELGGTRYSVSSQANGTHTAIDKPTALRKAAAAAAAATLAGRKVLPHPHHLSPARQTGQTLPLHYPPIIPRTRPSTAAPPDLTRIPKSPQLPTVQLNEPTSIPIDQDPISLTTQSIPTQISPSKSTSLLVPGISGSRLTTEEAEENKKVLATLLALPENALCADCDSPAPTWASTNHGAFICTQCSGVHRSLGVEHSFVLSSKLDDWQDKQVLVMSQNGNTTLNAKLEWHVPEPYYKPRPDEGRAYREKYIEAKYKTKLFIRDDRPPKPPRPPPDSVVALDTDPAAATQGMVEYMAMIRIRVICGKGLKATAGPHCVATIGTQKMQSRAAKHLVNPQWDQNLTLCWNGADLLTIEVRDKAGPKGTIGINQTHLTGLVENTAVDVWLPLVKPKYLDLTHPSSLCHNPTSSHQYFVLRVYLRTLHGDFKHPYISFLCGREKVKSKVVSKQDLRFEQELFFGETRGLLASEMLEIKVKEWNRMQKNRNLGGVNISLADLPLPLPAPPSSLLPAQPQDRELKLRLQDSNGNNVGTLSVSFSLIPIEQFQHVVVPELREDRDRDHSWSASDTSDADASGRVTPRVSTDYSNYSNVAPVSAANSSPLPAPIPHGILHMDSMAAHDMEDAGSEKAGKGKGKRNPRSRKASMQGIESPVESGGSGVDNSGLAGEDGGRPPPPPDDGDEKEKELAYLKQNKHRRFSKQAAERITNGIKPWSGTRRRFKGSRGSVRVEITMVPMPH